MYIVIMILASGAELHEIVV